MSTGARNTFLILCCYLLHNGKKRESYPCDYFISRNNVINLSSPLGSGFKGISRKVIFSTGLLWSNDELRHFFTTKESLSSLNGAKLR